MINARVGAALEHPEHVEAERRIDLSAEFHRTATMRLFESAGLDQELAKALYRVEWEPESRPAYPDVADVLAAVRARGATVAVVSDNHFDIRRDCVANGFDAFIDAYVLSCELGVQKPDPRMFLAALFRPGSALPTGRGPGGVLLLGVQRLSALRGGNGSRRFHRQTAPDHSCSTGLRSLVSRDRDHQGG
jgi:HAD superfamily hydrolase (TIGR01509 family)